MDSNQTWYEASLVCAHSFLWIWANSETPKIFTSSLYLVYCFSAEKCNFGSFITSAYHHGFHQNLVRVTPTMCTFSPVNMSKIWGIKKYHLLWCFHRQSLRSVPLGSLITIMNDHEFQPNLTWSIPTVPSFIPVNMSEIWGFKNFTFVLSNFFFNTQKFTKYHFYTLCTNYLKIHHKNGLSHLMRHWLHT